MKRLTDALQKAATDATLFMTADLRSKAASRGWDRATVNSMRVSRSDGNYAVKFPPSTGDSAFVQEYGDPERIPSGVIRKYDQAHPDLAEFFEERLARHLGGNI
jgi:hypothetical protein